MARTRKDVASYFPHDANASSGDTLTVLQSRFGNDGYAFWFKLLEKLTATNGHYLDLRNQTKWHVFIAKMGVNEITTVEILNLLVEMQAIDKNLWQSKLIWCQNLVDNLSIVYSNRHRKPPTRPIPTGDNAITTDSNAITTGGNQQSRVEYSIVDKNIIYGEFQKVKLTDEEYNKLATKQDGNIQESDWYKQFQATYPEFIDLDFQAACEWIEQYNQTHPRKPRNVNKAFLINWAKKNREGKKHGNNRQKPASRPGAPGYVYEEP